jgi:hypothetical protein
MSVISAVTKGKAGARMAKVIARSPGALAKGARFAWPVAKAAVPVRKAGLKASKPLRKRRARRRVEKVNDLARQAAEVLTVYAPRTAYELGLAEPPKSKRTAPRVAAGVVIGASAVYFLEPEHGREHREKVAQLVS